MRLIVKPLGIIASLLIFAVLTFLSVRGVLLPPKVVAPSVGSGDVTVLADTAKRSWLFDEVTFFNIAYREPDGQQKIAVTWKDMDTREAFKAILAGQQKPAVWVPSGSYWPTAMNSAWKRAHPGSGDLINTADTHSYRVYLRTPLVFLTTKSKAATLRPLLSGSLQRPSWFAFHDLCAGKVSTPWGRFRFSVADPLSSNSGFTMLAMVLVDYAQRTGRVGALDRVPKDPGFAQFIREMRTGLATDVGAEKGESALSAAYGENPAHCDLIVTYESNALKAVTHNPDLAVIYPDKTAVAEESAAALSGDWVNPDQRTAAHTFLDFLGRQEALSDGVRKHFRPAQPTDKITLAPELDRYRASGFQQVFTTNELPPYDTVNEVAYLWQGGTATPVKKP